MIRKNTEQFIEDCRLIHGDKYDYSLVDYVNNKTKVKIICPIHGIFEQTPTQHIILKQNCKKCCNDKFKSKNFIEKSKLIHGDKYDYSLVDYVNNKTKVKIICPIHGVFEQRPDNHLHNSCPLCSLITKRQKMIDKVEKKLKNGFSIFPNFNETACLLFDNISLKENIFIQHAMNGGEYHIKELGYWVDGYDKENNTVYEFDEVYHKYKKNQIIKDEVRQREIEKFLGCKFIRIKQKI